jgi:hypothetical protein
MKIAFEDNESIGHLSAYADNSNSSVWQEEIERDERHDHVPMINTKKRPNDENWVDFIHAEVQR